MLEILTIVAVLILDQASKCLTDLYLMPLGTSYPLWPGVFHLTSVHNRGAAWGMFQGGRIFFIAMTVAVLGCLILYVVKNRRRFSPFAKLTLSLIIGGAAGNLIDRLCFGYVRDMFNFTLIDFPVFNVADSALCVGCALIAINVLFMKDDSILGPEKQAAADSEPPREETHDG